MDHGNVDMIEQPTSAAPAVAGDEQLVADIQRFADESAWETLVARHRGRVRRLCAGRFSHAHLVEEGEVEVWWRVWRGLPAFRGRASFTTWLHRLTVNVCHDLDRARRRSIQRSGRTELLASEPAPDIEDWANERRAGMVHALATLSVSDRALLAARYDLGLGIDAIAERFGLGQSAVKMRIHRARSRLRSAIAA